MTSNQNSILVVEDEQTIREVVRRYLERDGFDVREAADGRAALDAVEDEQPDLIVLDLMLPGVDGSIRSSTIKSGCSSSTASSAARPSAASRTSNPSRSK